MLVKFTSTTGFAYHYDKSDPRYDMSRIIGALEKQADDRLITPGTMLGIHCRISVTQQQQQHNGPYYTNSNWCIPRKTRRKTLLVIATKQGALRRECIALICDSDS